MVLLSSKRNPTFLLHLQFELGSPCTGLSFTHMVLSRIISIVSSLNAVLLYLTYKIGLGHKEKSGKWDPFSSLLAPRFLRNKLWKMKYIPTVAKEAYLDLLNFNRFKIDQLKSPYK